MNQGGGNGGIRAPATVEQGLPIPVDVQNEGATEIIVVVGGNSNEKPQSIPVGPDRRPSIPPSPSWTPGTLIYISTATPPFVTIVVEITPAGE
jgi:hypothetical protein